ncbi:flagellar protein FlaG [Paenisporosarcina sp. TG-14]|uniref:flagellar protein FlaG n=1 Tax=Paenisporosarcina sp. TG-14 TaxID=1231057 RepID=UPI0003144E04|nr:flagellar protein FlaG [Paenisporosarcina sp. TG-14]
MEVKNTHAIYFPNHIDRIVVNPIQGLGQSDVQNNEVNEKITKEMVIHKVDELNRLLQPTPTSMKFKLHEELNIYYVQVIDTNTDAVLKEIPNKKFLDMYASMRELMGLIVDDKL